MIFYTLGILIVLIANFWLLKWIYWLMLGVGVGLIFIALCMRGYFFKKLYWHGAEEGIEYQAKLLENAKLEIIKLGGELNSIFLKIKEFLKGYVASLKE